MIDFSQVIARILQFRDERNWKQFHTPKNLAAAISIEAAELQETMLWKTDDEVERLLQSTDGKQKISAEIADVMIFCLLLCDATRVDPVEAIKIKLVENADKYPVDLSRNKSDKYTELG